ncbi:MULTISPECIES: A24 family peptidase [unclassified Streptomyces]|uniref:prepilin peptidase n=1 Tax=unclassified Streptomyces TaxID=2593676 RepID=UPI002151FD70|nr:A24 family peptidase [Streptomyces sp. KMM 9044]WAX78565.1 A24 family peptidase [Streptomyces sp. KMM 9044]
MNDLPVPPVGAVVLVAVLWGAVAGALLPRAVHRFAVPVGEEWRARCPAGHPLRGWLGRARCGQCAARAGGEGEGTAGTSYGPGPVAPAAATTLVCAALAAATGTRPELAVWLLLAPVGVLLAVVDFRVQRLPDPLTLPFAAATLALLGVVTLFPEHAGTWTTALLGALALGAGYFVLFLINPAGMGFGDVKLALGAGAVLGWYGWPTVMLGTFAGFLFGALYGGALVVARRAGRRTAIPFGPFLIAGAFVGLLIGAYTA